MGHSSARPNRYAPNLAQFDRKAISTVARISREQDQINANNHSSSDSSAVTAACSPVCFGSVFCCATTDWISCENTGLTLAFAYALYSSGYSCLRTYSAESKYLGFCFSLLLYAASLNGKPFSFASLRFCSSSLSRAASCWGVYLTSLGICWKSSICTEVEM